ncbi:pentatricopeptide repeat-containing protein At5g46100-like [Vigna umbellata]|uniref:pentatricopeptide repeat-containing protein At5g46100-like n=1 Tax=Vigna umbellata TaxID=87088 RepID=UPI001F5FC01A|nr:pentatricopeptide repeat-containing protein At5g46100-like [Vigna umbellata]
MALPLQQHSPSSAHHSRHTSTTMSSSPPSPASSSPHSLHLHGQLRTFLSALNIHPLPSNHRESHQTCKKYKKQPNPFPKSPPTTTARSTKNGDIETAEKLIGEMSLNGLYPDLITYMAIMEGLCDVGRPEHAYSLLKVMRVHRCSTNLVLLSAILNGLRRSGSMEMVLELLDEMEKGGDCRPKCC